MRFATRTFLWFSIPILLLLAASFGAIQSLTLTSVRRELRTSLRRSQIASATIRAKSELQNSRFLRIVGDNAPLKAGMQLVSASPGDQQARQTLEEQLREISNELGFDFLLASDAQGASLAAVVRKNGAVMAADPASLRPPQRGFYTAGWITYQVMSVPVNQADESVGFLAVGEQFDFASLSTPAVLTRNGAVLKSTVPGVSPEEMRTALAWCPAKEECDVKLRNETYLSLPMESMYFGDGYVLRSLESVDSSNAPVQTILRRVFLAAGIAAMLAALAISMVCSRSIVRPVGALVATLRISAAAGRLPRFEPSGTPIYEIHELMQSFNRAAAAIHEGEERLHRAYVEFAGSLANALDARDPYTAGHSRRVSASSCAIAEALRLPAQEVTEIQIGALLHDIGKIGIPDQVLQKPGKLTDEEFALINEHPTIGRHILEGVNDFQVYLDTVELHHENWDGSGYPRGLAGRTVPLGARIVHVVDAYDAMTSDRPYRKGMSHEQALSILQKCAGTQFDPDLVRVLSELAGGFRPTPSLESASLESLLTALRKQTVEISV